MLARTYKTAEELGILDETLEGLITIMHELRDGSLPWSDVATEHPTFNMAWGSLGNCRCIQGRLFERGISIHSALDSNMRLLVCPIRTPWRDITPDQAADAIERLLQGETDLWR